MSQGTVSPDPIPADHPPIQLMVDETGARRELGVGEAMAVPRYRWYEVRNESGADCVVLNLFSGVGEMADVGFEAIRRD